MKYAELRPMLWTSDLKGTRRFYTELLGFACDEFMEEFGFMSLSKDAVSLLFAKPGDDADFDGPAFTGSLYFTVDNIDELWDNLKEKISICYPIESFDYGMREFAAYDNNGYLLQFGKPIDKTN